MKQRSNSVSPKLIENTTETSVDQPNRSCKSIRNGKFWLILLLIILMISAIIILIIFLFKKDTIINTSSIITITITSSTTNKIEESSVINCITNRTKWKQNGTTVAMIDSFSIKGIHVDDHQSIYIADSLYSRVLKWEYNATSTQIVAGANGEGNRTDQLWFPLDVIVDNTNESIIICDAGNSRVMRWSCQNATSGDIIILEIECYGLAMDNEGFLYVVNSGQHEVRRGKIGNTFDTIVAGGNGPGSSMRELSGPSYIFVDQKHSVYVSDSLNNRVIKWMKNEKVGVVVAGDKHGGSGLNQLNFPTRIFIDPLGDIYVADLFNYRVVRWIKGATEGRVVVGGNGFGPEPNQLITPDSISFDRYGNLYIVDLGNRRIQRFDIDSN